MTYLGKCGRNPSTRESPAWYWGACEMQTSGMTKPVKLPAPFMAKRLFADSAILMARSAPGCNDCEMEGVVALGVLLMVLSIFARCLLPHVRCGNCRNS